MNSCKKSAHYIYFFYLGLWRLWKCYWNGEFERVLKAEVTGSVDYNYLLDLWHKLHTAA